MHGGGLSASPGLAIEGSGESGPVVDLTVADEPVALMQPTAVASLPGERALRGGTRYEVKLDGWRTRAAVRTGSRVDLRSRRGTPLASRFADLAAAMAGLPEGLVLDGEVVAATSAGTLDFLALQRTARARAAAGLTVLYVAFDVLAGPGGIDVRRRPLDERVAILGEVLAAHPGGRVQGVAATSDLATALGWMGALPEGMEGCVAKARASRYDPRDRRSWQKVRVADTVDLPLVGVVGPATRPRHLVVRRDGRLRLTSPQLTGPQARSVADALVGRVGGTRHDDDLGVTVRDVAEGLVAEVRAVSGRHQVLRFTRLRPDL
ncbi:DNA ligase [Streptomyces albidoflavus]